MPNRLVDESSPYLLQHANNPVDWFPWCQEALDQAKKSDKPIFLSIGYSACHWCHVMEHESFENDSIARILNDNFISIKVDREERPDLDQIYMNAVMALRQGQGGWPLSVFLTPNQEVFFGGTYWPPTSRVGMPGFDHVLHSVLDAFANRRAQLDEQSSQITKWLNETETKEAVIEISDQTFAEAVERLKQSFDKTNGGFGGAPKFPHCMDLALLVRLAKGSSEQDQLLSVVRLSLKKMAYGGIYDHLGGGFARYSVDEKWLVPHFEKMLYDNALLVDVYLDMYQATGDRFYSMIAEKTLNYLLNYLVDEDGGFHSTEDADSEGVEGKFYVWSKKEIVDALGSETGERFCRLYNVAERGNFEGSNILNMTVSYQKFAEAESVDKEELRNEMRTARESLLEIRDKRIRPAKDDKILVNWNGLAISAFARAAVILDNVDYANAASKVANFIFDQLTTSDGKLFHTWRNGQAKIDAFLDDYSFMIVALLDLYEIDLDSNWVVRASSLADFMVKHFSAVDGGFYYTSDEQEKLIARQISFQDGSIPSGNSMAAIGLTRLACLTGRTEWKTVADRTIDASGTTLSRSVLSAAQSLIAAYLQKSIHRLFVVIGTNEIEIERIKSTFKRVRPENSSIVFDSGEPSADSPFAPILNGKTSIDGRTTLYECVGFECHEPVVGVEEIGEKIRSQVEA